MTTMDTRVLSLASLLLLTLTGLLWLLQWLLERWHDRRSQRSLDAIFKMRRATQTPATEDTEDPPAPARAWWLLVLHSPLGQGLVGEEDRLMLEQAGFNNENYRGYYSSARVGLALALGTLTLLLYQGSGSQVLLGTMAALAVGLFLPKWLLTARAGQRKRALLHEIPLFVDLLRLLQGTGMSLDLSLRVTAGEFRDILPVLGTELDIANRQYAAGRSRNESLRRLTRLYGEDELDELVTLLVQIDRHGGAVQEPMRQYSARLREKRRAHMRELVGKINVKMTVTMIVTLLPALMIVIAGPAFLSIFKGLAKVGT